MLTTSRRLAWVSSLLARSPRCTARISRRRSVGVVDARRRSARPRGVPVLDQLGEPPLVVAGEQVDLADLAQVHAHTVRRRARRLAAPPAADRAGGGAG